MKCQQTSNLKKMFFCLTLFFIGLMSASIVHAENYTFVTKWGSYGTEGSLNIPWDVAVDSSSNVYVVEEGNNSIQKFSSSGKFITKWGSEGSGDGQFKLPRGIAIDSSDNVYVTDHGNYRIQKFDSNGKFITKWGSEGGGDGQFYYPNDVAVDSSGNVYVIDMGNYRIQKFAKEKATPGIIWSSPADITSGTALSNTELNAIFSVPGIFVYTPKTGTVLSEGTHTLHVDFTPADAASYTTSSKDVTINVKKSTSPLPSLELPAVLMIGLIAAIARRKL